MQCICTAPVAKLGPEPRRHRPRQACLHRRGEPTPLGLVTCTLVLCGSLQALPLPPSRTAVPRALCHLSLHPRLAPTWDYCPATPQVGKPRLSTCTRKGDCHFQSAACVPDARQDATGAAPQPFGDAHPRLPFGEVLYGGAACGHPLEDMPGGTRRRGS